MTIDVSDAIYYLLADNRSPDPDNPDVRRPPEYRIAATLDGDLLELVLTFRRECAYCCMEWGCHLGFVAGERWLTLRQVLSAENARLPDKLRMRLRCVIEEGARFFDLSLPDRERRDRYAFKSADAFSYEVSVVEGGRG